jgi:cytoskeleton protein RodZ
MPPIGDTLREARMRQRLDIVDVEERTKIRAKYLRALENEEWGLLPGPTFVRTFLRTYAEAVGLDPHVLVDEYRSTQEDIEPPEPHPAPIGGRGGRRARASRPEPGYRPPRTPRPSRPPGPLVLLGAVVVGILILFLVLGLVGSDDSSKSDQASKTTQTATTPKRRARPRPRPKARPAGVTLKIAPAVPTYVCLDTGQGSPHVFEGILSSPRTFKNRNQLRANLGKRQVKLTANGKAVPVQPSAEPLGVQVTKTGATEITNGPRPCA